MIRWREAYERLKGSAEFTAYFGKGRMPLMTDFRFIAYTTIFEGVASSGESDGGVFGQQSGPLNQQFPAGAVILGITASAWQNYEPCSDATPGRRDRFGLAFQYSGNELLTANGLTMADALLGGGVDTIFPAKELLIPPSQTILVTAASLTPTEWPVMTIHVVFHSMVPRVIG